MPLYKRGRIWWFWFSRDGKRYQISTGSTNKDIAKRAEARKLTELDEGRNNLPSKAKPMSFPVAGQKWLEVKGAQWSRANLAIQNYNLAHLNQHLGRMLLSKISADSIGIYQGLRKKEQASPRTINMEVGTVRMILKWRKLWGPLADEVKMLREPKSCGKALTPDEETRLLAACRKSPQPSLYTAVVIFSNTGLRNAELRTARWSQVNFLERPTFAVGEKAKTEGSAGRVIPLNADALAALKEWRTRWQDAKPEDFIFPSEKLKFKGEGSVERCQMTSYGVDRTNLWPRGKRPGARRRERAASNVGCTIQGTHSSRSSRKEAPRHRSLKT